MEGSRSHRSQRVAAFVLSVAAPTLLGLPACTESHTGTLIIPVQQRTGDGSVYHLTGMLHVTSVDYVAGASIQVDLNSAGRSQPFEVDQPPGLNYTTMDSGWTLERASDASATFEIVPATWVNDSSGANRLGVFIEEGKTTTVQFRFRVHAANGDLDVIFGTP